MKEEWRSANGWEGIYEVSDHGRVRSTERTITYASRWGTIATRLIPEKIKRPTRLHRDKKYSVYVVTLYKEGEATTIFVHKLVMDAFVGPRPLGFQIAHYDGDIANNALSNLRYATPRDNSADKLRHGTTGKGEKHPSAKLDDARVLAIRMLEGLIEGREIAKAFGISKEQVSKIHNGTRWGHLA